MGTLPFSLEREGSLSQLLQFRINFSADFQSKFYFNPQTQWLMLKRPLPLSPKRLPRRLSRRPQRLLKPRMVTKRKPRTVTKRKQTVTTKRKPTVMPRRRPTVNTSTALTDTQRLRTVRLRKLPRGRQRKAVATLLPRNPSPCQPKRSPS